MEEMIEKLSESMEKEINLYSDILKLVRKERDILVSDRELELENNLKEQNELILIALQEEKNRLAITGEIAERMGIESNESVTISNILKNVEGDQKHRLKQAGDSLGKLIVKISEINENNIFLIEQGRKDFRHFIGLITDSNSVGVYLKDGRIKSGSGTKNNLINKVV